MLYKIVMWDPDTSERIINDIVEYTDMTNPYAEDRDVDLKELLDFIGDHLEKHGWQLGDSIHFVQPDEPVDLENFWLTATLYAQYDNGPWQTLEETVYITKNLDY